MESRSNTTQVGQLELLFSAAYTAEISHFADGQGYTACLNDIYRKPPTNTYFALGFKRDDAFCGPTSTQTASCTLGVDSTWFNTTQRIGGSIATNVSVSRGLDSRTNSVAVADGHFIIDGLGFIGQGFLDIWQISGRKKLRDLKVTLPNPGGSP